MEYALAARLLKYLLGESITEVDNKIRLKFDETIGRAHTNNKYVVRFDQITDNRLSQKKAPRTPYPFNYMGRGIIPKRR
jgi:hypothetical protein